MVENLNVANRLVLNTAMAEGLDVIGDRWALLILRDVFLGRVRFEQLLKHTGAGRSTLTRRLAALVSHDVLYKHPYANARYEYKLTEKGLGLYGASLLAWQWEVEWAHEREGALPPALDHALCGQTLVPQAVCRFCHETLVIGDVKWLNIEASLDAQFSEIKSLNRQRRTRPKKDRLAGVQDTTLEHIADLVGDRWSVLILVSAFFGISQYDDFLRQLNIATNILGDRLKGLVSAGVFERRSYQDNPPRSDYKLTNKGKSLYPFIMSLRQWVIDWLPERDPDSDLIHLKCDHKLTVDVRCTDCGQKPWPRDVGYR